MEARGIRLQGERAISRKAIAQGMPECSDCTCMLVCVFFALIAHETAGAACTRHSLLPPTSRDKVQARLGRVSCRENVASYSVVIVREGGRSSIPETPMINTIGRGVLDTPHARGMTASGVAALEDNGPADAH